LTGENTLTGNHPSKLKFISRLNDFVPFKTQVLLNMLARAKEGKGQNPYRKINQSVCDFGYTDCIDLLMTAAILEDKYNLFTIDYGRDFDYFIFVLYTHDVDGTAKIFGYNSFKHLASTCRALGIRVNQSSTGYSHDDLSYQKIYMTFDDKIKSF
jgi:hypothetical protein